MANQNHVDENNAPPPFIIPMRILAIAILLGAAFAGAAYLRQSLFSKSSHGADYRVAFLGDSILGLGASKSSPYHFLRAFLEQESINAISLSQPALSSVDARNSLEKNPSFSKIETFVVMLGRSEVARSRYETDLNSLKKFELDSETRVALDQIKEQLIKGDLDAAKSMMSDLDRKTSVEALHVFLEVWRFSIEPSAEKFPQILARLENLKEAPLKFYSIVRHTLAAKSMAEENGLIISKMLARYGRQPDVVSALAWHEDRKGCNQTSMNLFEESIKAGEYDMRTIYHVFNCYRELGQKDKRAKLIESLAKSPDAPAALKIMAARGFADDVGASSETDPHQRYLNDLYLLEKSGDTEKLKTRFLHQSSEEGVENLHSSRALPELINWMTERGKSVVYVSYPNDVVPKSLQEISSGNLKIVDTKSLLEPYLSSVSATQLLADDYEHFSVLGSCLVAIEISKHLKIKTEVRDPLAWCQSQR